MLKNNNLLSLLSLIAGCVLTACEDIEADARQIESFLIVEMPYDQDVHMRRVYDLFKIVYS